MEVTLTLEVDEVNVILTSLSRMPYEAVVNLVQKIVEQGKSQLVPTDEVVEEDQEPAQA